MNGIAVANDHTGYTGQGFAAGFQGSGNSVSFQVTVPSDGTYQLDARYANATGGAPVAQGSDSYGDTSRQRNPWAGKPQVGTYESALTPKTLDRSSWSREGISVTCR